MCVKYDYIKDRLEPQMRYYSKASRKDQIYYCAFSIISLICTASIPLISLSAGRFGLAAQYVCALLGVVASITTGVASVSRYRDKWTNERATYENLKSELAKYQSAACDYFKLPPDESYNLLIKNCESYMKNEHATWEQIISKNKTD